MPPCNPLACSALTCDIKLRIAETALQHQIEVCGTTNTDANMHPTPFALQYL